VTITNREREHTPTRALATSGTIALRDLRPFESRRVELLDQRAVSLVNQASTIGANIKYLGVAPLFNEPRIYPGADTDWVIAPADEHEHVVVPREQRRVLQRLVDDGIDFRTIYVAHEVDRARRQEVAGDGLGPGVVTRQQGIDIVGPVPLPAAALEVGDRLDVTSQRVLSAIGKAAPVAGGLLLGILAAPFVVVGAAVAGLATLDPIVIGAIPALSPHVGEPAAFFELTSWDW
jgi:hypothetical protein